MDVPGTGPALLGNLRKVDALPAGEEVAFDDERRPIALLRGGNDISIDD